MLIVFMAIINFSRMKVYAATRWLWLALSGGLFIAAPIGCEDEEPQVLYGPPADTIVLDGCDLDVVQPEYGVPVDVTEDVYVQDFQVLYGPPPDYIEPDAGQDLNVQPLYGPMDIIDDYVPPQDVLPIDAIQPLYGPVEIIDDVPGEDIPADLPQVLYGPAVQ